jgi:hypothetical protein
VPARLGSARLLHSPPLLREVLLVALVVRSSHFGAVDVTVEQRIVSDGGEDVVLVVRGRRLGPLREPQRARLLLPVAPLIQPLPHPLEGLRHVGGELHVRPGHVIRVDAVREEDRREARQLPRNPHRILPSPGRAAGRGVGDSEVRRGEDGVRVGGAEELEGPRVDVVGLRIEDHSGGRFF